MWVEHVMILTIKTVTNNTTTFTKIINCTSAQDFYFIAFEFIHFSLSIRVQYTNVFKSCLLWQTYSTKASWEISLQPFITKSISTTKKNIFLYSFWKKSLFSEITCQYFNFGKFESSYRKHIMVLANRQYKWLLLTTKEWDIQQATKVFERQWWV